MKSIHLNASIPDDMLPFVCANELGHTILHPNINTPFLRKHTLFSIDKIERQANAFAVELLLPDEFLAEYSDINFATMVFLSV
ncbi:MAG: ImmA/IrrE family metallo-endopeptidase [Veillonella dispar]|uniref:ImmA/IrrE family metallo-endopeptidase n=1 Tax=Veillonella dispar TaxID=39778 RepID=UPI0026F2B05F|nr:ImmA/IrrE family metallo-endopeptidase [Veillonella dispar]MBS6382501.1 ImmA/IrrE family metallo-endopeptidase [Veillonella dispar]